MDPSRPRASAVAMAGGRITGTGDDDQLRRPARMRGVLAPGKLADLVVLGTNPWQVPADALPGVAVDQVWIGGELRH
jgi:predicted amidohydrolase YtcJ